MRQKNDSDYLASSETYRVTPKAMSCTPTLKSRASRRLNSGIVSQATMPFNLNLQGHTLPPTGQAKSSPLQSLAGT